MWREREGSVVLQLGLCLLVSLYFWTVSFTSGSPFLVFPVDGTGWLEWAELGTSLPPGQLGSDKTLAGQTLID